MKLKSTAALCAALFASTCVLAQVALGATPLEAQRAGILKDIRGNVRLLGSDGVSRPARAGDALAPIERIETEPNAAAGVVLRDGTSLVVGPSSRLDLKEFHFDSTTRDGGILISLVRGSLRMITGLIGKTQPDAVRVETPTATIGIRGTDFIVQADPAP